MLFCVYDELWSVKYEVMMEFVGICVPMFFVWHIGSGIKGGPVI